jgi:ABC-type transport system substrate-binding protein
VRWAACAAALTVVGTAAVSLGGAGVSSAATSQQAAGDQVVKVALFAGSIDHLEPARWYYAVTWSIANLTCTTLLVYPDKAGEAGKELVGGLATGLPKISAGGTKYTYTLRSGLKFSDGKPLGPLDVKHTFERAISPEITGLPGQAFYGDIVGAQAYMKGKAKSVSGITTTSNTVTFRLTAPNGSFLQRVAMKFTCPVPKDTPMKAFEDGSLPATGPYAISKYSPNRELDLRRNANYPASLPKRGNVDGFDMQIGVDPEQAYLKIKSGDTDLTLGQIPAADAIQANRDPSLKGRVFANSQAGIVYFWMNYDVKPLDNIKLRQAVNYAIDRTQIVRVTGGPLVARPADQILPPTMPGWVDSKNYPFTPDLAKAKALMKASGVKTPVNITINANTTYPTYPRVAQVIQEDLKPLGINVTIKTAPAAVLDPAEAVRKNHINGGIGTWTQDYPDPDDFLNPLLDPRTPDLSGEKSRFDDTAVGPLFAAAQRKVGDARNAAYEKLDQLLMRKYAAWAPLYNPGWVDVLSSRLSGYVYHPVYNAVNLATLRLK